MAAHVLCLKMLILIVRLLWSDDADKHVTKLLELASEHHDMTLELYGIKLAGKPKLHYLYHAILGVSQFGRYLSCF